MKIKIVIFVPNILILFETLRFFELLQNDVIRHMWRVANGLDNAGLEYFDSEIVAFPSDQMKRHPKKREENNFSSFFLLFGRFTPHKFCKVDGSRPRL
jgi:hypothetical protein